MSKDVNIQELEKEYLLVKSDYEIGCDEITRQLLKILNDNQIKLAVPIQSRIKEWSSILDKYQQKRFNIKKSITELQDILGIRLILLFKRDVDKITELIKQHFKVLKQYNTADKLEDNQFGYLSIHEIIQLKEEWLEVPTLKSLKNLKIEIQIRTLSQHAWAEASNIFQYKNETNVPKPLKRTIGRISALLETVDLEFERILIERESYQEKITSHPINTKQLLNVDLLKQILTNLLPKESVKINEPYSELLSELEAGGITDANSLIKIIHDNIAGVLERDRLICEQIIQNYENKQSLTCNINGKCYRGYYKEYRRIKNGHFFSHVGIVREILTNLCSRSHSK